MYRRRLLRTGGVLLAAAAGGCADGLGTSTVTRNDSVTPTVTHDAVDWSTSFDVLVAHTPAVADGTVYVGLFEGDFHTIDASDGIEDWHASLRQHVLPAIPAGDAAVVVTSEHDGDPAVMAFDTVDGSERWTLDPGERLRTPAVDEQRAFGASDSGLLRALVL